MLVALTAWPDWVTVAFQAEVSFWSPAKEKPTVQPLTALVPVLLTTTFAVKPPGHSLVVV